MKYPVSVRRGQLDTMLTLKLERGQHHSIAGVDDLMLGLEIVKQSPCHGVIAVVDQLDNALPLRVYGSGNLAG